MTAVTGAGMRLPADLDAGPQRLSLTRTKQELRVIQPNRRNAVSRLEREKWRAEISAKFPHHVDVVPPPMGYSRSEEEEIGEFLESRIGTFDLFGAIADGTPFVRYCFLHAADAQAFCEQFDRCFRAQTPVLQDGNERGRMQ
jgi:hypothetical protein